MQKSIDSVLARAVNQYLSKTGLTALADAFQDECESRNISLGGNHGGSNGGGNRGGSNGGSRGGSGNHGSSGRNGGHSPGGHGHGGRNHGGHQHGGRSHGAPTHGHHSFRGSVPSVQHHAPVQHKPAPPTPVQYKPTPTQPTPNRQAPGKDITVAQLQKIMPTAKLSTLEKYTPILNQVMKDFGINSAKRQNAFIAQIAHETKELHYMTELGKGTSYQGRMGNKNKGDGEMYKGRGPIQLTGKNNYKAAGKALGLDLLNHPDLVATPEVGMKVAGWFWSANRLNNLADKNTKESFSQITKAINGCADCKTTHAQDRNNYWNAANEANKD